MEYREVADGLGFPEGPLELPGGDILVTDIQGGTLLRINPASGAKTVFATTGGGPNGAAIGPVGPRRGWSVLPCRWVSAGRGRGKRPCRRGA